MKPNLQLIQAKHEEQCEGLQECSRMETGSYNIYSKTASQNPVEPCVQHIRAALWVKNKHRG